MKDPFIILGCDKDASKEEIIKKYKLLAKKYHPDKNITSEFKKDREEQFKEITCAFQFLKTNNFKYTSTKDYSKFSDIFKTRFFNTNDKIYDVLSGIKNFDFDSLADNMLKGITTIQDIYDNSDERLERQKIYVLMQR